MVNNLLAIQETWFDPWFEKSLWRREWLPTPVFLPGEFHGQRSRAGYSLWGRKELDMIEQLTLSLSHEWIEGFPSGSDGKKSACSSGDLGLIPGLGRSPGEGKSYPLQYSQASLVAKQVKNLPAMRETWV